jgi:hypothetical protein
VYYAGAEPKPEMFQGIGNVGCSFLKSSEAVIARMSILFVEMCGCEFMPTRIHNKI